MEKRVLIAILLSFVVFFGYSKLVAVIYPDYAKEAQLKQEQPAAGMTPISGTGATSAAGVTSAAGTPFAGSGSAIVPANAALSAVPDQILPVRLPKYELAYSKNAASFTEAKLTGYPDAEGGPFRFLQSVSGKVGTGAIDTVLVDDRTVSDLSFETSQEGRQIRSTADAGKVTVEKSWNLSDDGYGQGLMVAITNHSDAPVRVRYRILTGSKPVVHNSIDDQYIEANWLTEANLTHIRKPGLNKPKSLSEPVIAASIKSRHFSSILKPIKTTGTFSAHVEAYDKMNFGSYLVRSEAVVQPGETLSDGFLWYVGPNRVEDLMPYELDRLVNFGKLDFIAKIVLGGLHMIAGVVKNYGIAIIVLTLLTNMLFMPLTRVSFMSMRRMQLVQPEATRLREKHKDNPAKLNEETMALYKKHKVNPMGGCLPMLLQMPIFMGLYVSLSKAPELLGGSFLWVKDLASPDVIKLPLALPMIGDNIHLLPIIMVGAMFAQQKISMGAMASPDPNMAQQQKIMMYVMPVMFGFIFYKMPSGLVVYWLTNTLVMTAYQAYLKKSNPVPAVPAVG